MDRALSCTEAKSNKEGSGDRVLSVGRVTGSLSDELSVFWDILGLPEKQIVCELLEGIRSGILFGRASDEPADSVFHKRLSKASQKPSS